MCAPALVTRRGQLVGPSGMPPGHVTLRGGELGLPRGSGKGRKGGRDGEREIQHGNVTVQQKSIILFLSLHTLSSCLPSSSLTHPFSLKLFCPSISLLELSVHNWVNPSLFISVNVTMTVICYDMLELFTPFKTGSQSTSSLFLSYVVG